MDKAYSLAKGQVSITHLAVIVEFPLWLLWGLRVSSPAQSVIPHPLLPLPVKHSPDSVLGWSGKCHCSLMTVAILYIYLLIHRELKTRKFSYLYSSCLCSVTLYYSNCSFKPFQTAHSTYWRYHLQASHLPFTILQAPRRNKTLFLTAGTEIEKCDENTLHVPSAF